MHILALMVPLSYTENTVGIVITLNGEYVFDKNNKVRLKLGLPPLAQPGTIVHLNASFIGGSYKTSKQIAYIFATSPFLLFITIQMMSLLMILYLSLALRMKYYVGQDCKS